MVTFHQAGFFYLHTHPVLTFFLQGREGPSDMGATATYELDTEFDRDARAICERSIAVNKVRFQSGIGITILSPC